MLIPTATATATLRITAYFPVTWDDGIRDRGTFLVIFDSVNTDIVLHARIQVFKSAGVLVGVNHFFQRASQLPFRGGCGYSVASDIWRGSCHTSKFHTFMTQGILHYTPVMNPWRWDKETGQ